MHCNKVHEQYTLNSLGKWYHYSERCYYCVLQLVYERQEVGHKVVQYFILQTYILAYIYIHMPKLLSEVKFFKVSHIYRKVCSFLEMALGQIIIDSILYCVWRAFALIQENCILRVSHRDEVDLSIYFSLKSTTRKTAVYGWSCCSLATGNL